MGPFDWLPHAPLEPLQLDWLNGVEVAVLRLDRIDPLISGNKWFKLSEHLALAQQAGADVAAELDAKRAINQGSRLAAEL